ncbi:MAG TPA: spore coat U domain-containing protein [Allosphingosinicella sp.]|jgi:spore coat protein U-like protein
MTPLYEAARPPLAFAAVLTAFTAAAPAHAGNASSSLSVNATVTANCTVSTSAVAFGSVNTLDGGNVDATGGITVTCTNGTGWSASAGAGAGSGASMATRKMVSGSNLLSYTLFTDASRTAVWGDGTGSTSQITSTGTGSGQSLTIYGRVFAGQASVPAGSYADTVSVTVTY